MAARAVGLADEQPQTGDFVGTGLNAGALWQLDSIAGSFQPIPCARPHRTADSDMPGEPEGKRGPMVVSLREFIFVTVGSVVLSLAILAALWPWARQPRRLLAIGLATAIGIIAWNTALNLTNATGLNVDSPVLGLSAQDVGSGVAAFLITLLVLRFVTERAEPTSRVLGASGIVGIVTIVVDLFG